MRMWSLHPGYLDRAGLVACWRESLLAQAVLAGRTRGYRNHPQLERFRGAEEPRAAIAAYLWGLREEAVGRGYRFDPARIDLPLEECRGVGLRVTSGQMGLEAEHLRAKLEARAPERLPLPGRLEPHPLFTVVPGAIEPWERAVPR
ncbi:pyrimidine dimer DNA glycosylase/endonuclease V [Actinomyces bowdenii]|uniref:Pyrimidine dimer DNA glycosylase n=1 Tax=Actinomyces bowdenii TaxID=131109 RepID=A0A853EJD3_9ACTO|nr:pyrimidine dimer DNA glycosylase/endonuclease V [Actinomyces bowdenii]MBF0696149.1 pyrimidine dimer DNA glycosylase [Actinomyces bowdenii]NYS68322.1 pyrimidine dimer DNA glycosylase [Actinomyces bowdenii]